MQSFLREMRAMLLQFERSDLRDLYFRRGEWAVFFARPGGAANPMLAGEEDGADGGDAEAMAFADVPAPVAVTAPHLGIFAAACAEGEDVAAGDVVARIDVLGRKTDVVAGVAGRIAGVLVAENDLVEYGDRLVAIEAAA